MIVCKNCFNGNESHQEAEFDYWQWFDATEDFNDPHGRYCDVCGTEFNDGDIVIIMNDVKKYFDLVDKANSIDELINIAETACGDDITPQEYYEVIRRANIKIREWKNHNEI